MALIGNEIKPVGCKSNPPYARFSAFLNGVNPIGTAIASASQTTTVQQAGNVAIAQAVLNIPNDMAFLKAISEIEGGGYNIIYGGSTVPNSALSSFPDSHIPSASGEYQINRLTFNTFSKLLGLYDFSDKTQDLMGASILHSTGADTALAAGNFVLAVTNASHKWAAVPKSTSASNYQKFVNDYTANGGQLPLPNGT